MLPEFNSKEFKDYIAKLTQKDKAHRHHYYDESKDHACEMSVHISGTSPGHLIDAVRPNEPEEVKKYRVECWQPVTKSKSKKVISILNRIFNQRLYSIAFNPPPTGTIKDEEALDQYLDKEFPFYRNLINYIKEVFTKRCLEDPNAVCVIKPPNLFEEMEMDDDGNYVQGIEFFKPIPEIYSCHQVLDFEPEEYYVIDITHYEKPSDRISKLLILDQEYIRVIEIESTQSQDVITITDEYEHGMGTPPCFRLGGVITHDRWPYCYESFIAGVLPHWNKAVMIQSDADAVRVLHAYPERWEYESEECKACGGDGRINIPLAPGEPPEKQRRTACPNCGGRGKIRRGPFDVITINRDALAPEAPLPIPPAGYIEKNLSVLDTLETLVDKNIEAGLSAINMDIVSKVGENQSGIAKTIDRQDLDSFLMQFSDHIFDYVIPNIINITIYWRYVLPGMITEVEKYEYSIEKPKRFDVLSIAYLIDELSMAKQSNLDANVISFMQIDIIEKMFSGATKEKIQSILKLDPYPGYTVQELFVLKGNGIATEQGWFVKANLSQFVEMAIEADDQFLSYPLEKKREIIFKMAQEKLKDKPRVIPSNV